MMLSYASALGFAFFHSGHSHGQTSTFANVFFFFFGVEVVARVYVKDAVISPKVEDWKKC